jgi:hypothetical protein
MRGRFSHAKSSWRIIASVALLCIVTGCEKSSIIGKWSMSGGSNATAWEFKTNGAVVVGHVSGRYKFGDQDRIKIQTPFATTVYQLKISGDHMILQEPGGSKQEFTRIRQ